MAIKRLLKDPLAKGLRKSRHNKVRKDGQMELSDTREWMFHKAPAIVVIITMIIVLVFVLRDMAKSE